MFETSRLLPLLLLPLLLSACIEPGKFTYDPPQNIGPDIPTSVVVKGTRNTVFSKLVKGLSGTNFIMEQVDMPSGIIIAGYSGNPETYLDCGWITSELTNGQERVKYNFPAARAAVNYLMADGFIQSQVDRHMRLTAKLNIILEPKGVGRTNVTLATRYALNKTVRANSPGGVRNFDETIAFGSRQSGTFASGTVCVSNGVLEAQVLGLVQ